MKNNQQFDHLSGINTVTYKLINKPEINSNLITYSSASKSSSAIIYLLRKWTYNLFLMVI